MRGIVVGLVLITLSLSALQALQAGTTTRLPALEAGPTSGPKVILSVDGQIGQRYLQLSDRGPVFPTADVTCDGNRRSVALTRSSNAGDRTIATYAVPPKVSEVMLRSAECR